MSDQPEYKVTTHADPDTITAIDNLVRRSANENAVLSVYSKAVNGVPCTIVVDIGSALGSGLVTCVDALRKHVEKMLAESEQKETRH